MAIKREDRNLLEAMAGRLSQLAKNTKAFSGEERAHLRGVYDEMTQLVAARNPVSDIQHISGLDDLIMLLGSGTFEPSKYGRVSMAVEEGLAQFCADDGIAVPNTFEALSRGLILNTRTLQVQARPFDAFRVYTPGGLPDDARLPIVTPYIYGGRGGFAYFHDGGVKVGTRRAIVDEELTEWFRTNLADNVARFPKGVTVLLEFVADDIGAPSKAVLLAIRNNASGTYAPPSRRKQLADALELETIPNLSSKSPLELLEQAASTANPFDGFVVVDQHRSHWLIFPQEQQRGAAA